MACVNSKLLDDWGTLGVPAQITGIRLVHRIETRAAILRHAVYEAGAFVPLHTHDCDTLVYGVGGPCHELAGSCQGLGTEMIKRRLTFHPRGYSHSLRFLGPTHVLAIEMPERGLPDGRALAWPSQSVPLPATLYDDIWRAMLRIADRHARESITEALATLIARAARFSASHRPHWLTEVVDHLHATWRNVPSVNALACEFGVSPQHLCRAFKSHFDVTIGQYSLLLRLDNARGLLWGTGMPISEVAAETGFSDQSHLTRVLASHSQRTPARLRWHAPCLRTGIPMTGAT